MNARTHVIELTLEDRQVEEFLQCFFHTLLFHRTMGKINFEKENEYGIGSTGMVDVDCNYFDCTYVRLGSDDLDASIKRDIKLLNYNFKPKEIETSNKISLEFYQKRKAIWPLPAECTPWEVWSTKMTILKLNTEGERLQYHKSVGDVAKAKILYIAQAMDRHDYVPKLTCPQDADLIYDTSYSDVQPFLYRICQDLHTSVGKRFEWFVKQQFNLYNS